MVRSRVAIAVALKIAACLGGPITHKMDPGQMLAGRGNLPNAPDGINVASCDKINKKWLENLQVSLGSQCSHSPR